MKYINLNYILDIENYSCSLDKWADIIVRFPGHKWQHHQYYFDKYLSLIKPIIHRFHHFTSLLNPSAYAFYSTKLSTEQVDRLLDLYESLKPFEILTGQPDPTAKTPIAQLQEMEMPNLVPLLKLNLKTKPTNHQLKYWYHTLAVTEVTAESYIIKGKGVGNKELGMPTANLQVNKQLEQTLIQFLNGIYIVKFEILDGKWKDNYRGVASLGTNPHYENLKGQRNVEVYVFNDFGQEKFYGCKVKLTLLRIIRFEGKFHTFDAFLNAMHNDIQVARMYSE